MERATTDIKGNELSTPRSWRWVLAATLAWLVGLLGSDAYAPLAAFLFAGWVGLPVTIALDAREVREWTAWTPWWQFYVAGSFVPGVAILVGTAYLLRRWRAIGLE